MAEKYAIVFGHEEQRRQAVVRALEVVAGRALMSPDQAVGVRHQRELGSWLSGGIIDGGAGPENQVHEYLLRENIGHRILLREQVDDPDAWLREDQPVEPVDPATGALIVEIPQDEATGVTAARIMFLCYEQGVWDEHAA